MLGQIALAVAGLAVLIGLVSLGFVMSFRTKNRLVLTAVRRTGRRFTNPRVLRTAGRAGSKTSVVHHVGRTRGTSYRTPVVTALTADGFVIALPYGPRADWVRNVLAAGGASIERDGETVRVEAPRLVTRAEGNPYFAPKDQRTHRRFGIDDFLVVQQATHGLASVPSQSTATGSI